MAYACASEAGGLELRYLTAPSDGGFVIWRCQPEGDPPSLADVWPLLGWYEREIMDLYGLRFSNHPEPIPLVLHPSDVAPTLPEVAAGDVQTLPFGPVRADVVESAEFTFFYIGERILHYQPHLFFKHRGMEARFEGIDPQRGVVLAERVSGVGSVAHALAFCQAVEVACDCVAPERVAGCAR